MPYGPNRPVGLSSLIGPESCWVCGLLGLGNMPEAVSVDAPRFYEPVRLILADFPPVMTCMFRNANSLYRILTRFIFSLD